MQNYSVLVFSPVKDMMAAVFVVFCWSIVSLALPVTPNGNDFNGHFISYSPGIIQDVWHIPAAAAHFLNEVPQLHNFDEFASMFAMPSDIQALLERRNSFSLRIMNCMSLINFLIYWT